MRNGKIFLTFYIVSNFHHIEIIINKLLCFSLHFIYASMIHLLNTIIAPIVSMNSRFFSFSGVFLECYSSRYIPDYPRGFQGVSGHFKSVPELDGCSMDISKNFRSVPVQYRRISGISGMVFHLKNALVDCKLF